MGLDLAAADARIAEHRARVARADRFGPLRSTGSATAALRRTSPAAATAVGNLLRAVGAALRGAGALPRDGRAGLRSKEHDLAALGVRWPTDAAYDSALAEELQAARRRRLAAGTITPLVPGRPARSHAAATDIPRVSSGGASARVGARLRVTSHSAAAGGIGQSGA